MELERSKESLLETKESQREVIRYLVWLVPSVGFIGTIIGISEALENAHKVITDSGPIETRAAIQQITASLGIAFDTTLVALIWSAILLLFYHFITRGVERRIEQGEYIIESNVLEKLREKSTHEGDRGSASLYTKIKKFIEGSLPSEKRAKEVNGFLAYLDNEISKLSKLEKHE